MNGVFMQKRRLALLFSVVAFLAALPYLRSFGLPPIEDDYIQIVESRKYGPPANWLLLSQDALYRCRFTSLVLTYATEQCFGFHQWVFNLQSILLHMANALLLVALGRWRDLGFGLSFLAAAAWAVTERHHEAVLWYAALPEQLVFFFVLAALNFWLRWWQDNKTWHLWASMACYVLALLSKESAVVFPALAFLPLLFQPSQWRRALQALSPAILLAILYFALNVSAQQDNLHWNDGTFRPGWQFGIVITHSVGRLFWLWGSLALLAIFYWRKNMNWRMVLFACLWILICLAPYSLLTYMPRVPSRHVYLASFGVALIIAKVIKHSWNFPWLCTIGCTLFVLSNSTYILTAKHDQLLKRALVTETLVQAASKINASAYEVRCFPHDPQLAVLALHVRLHIPLADVDARRDGDCTAMEVRAWVKAGERRILQPLPE